MNNALTLNESAFRGRQLQVRSSARRNCISSGTDSVFTGNAETNQQAGIHARSRSRAWKALSWGLPWWWWRIPSVSRARTVSLRILHKCNQGSSTLVIDTVEVVVEVISNQLRLGGGPMSKALSRIRMSIEKMIEPTLEKHLVT